MLAVLITGGTVSAQKISETDVPAAVKTKFANLYPNIKVEKWRKEDGNYSAEFDQNKLEMCVSIDPKGNLIHTKAKIEASGLPKGVNDYVEKKYPGKKITEACKMTNAKGVITYKAEVKEVYLVFDSKGTFIKEVKEKEKEKDKPKDKM